MKRTLAATLLFLLFISIHQNARAQAGTLSGDFQGDLQVFQRDSAIGAINTPQYDNYFTGLASWLMVNYSIYGFNASIRFDAFNNSNLQDPTQAYTGAGIGYFKLEKEIGKLTIAGGVAEMRLAVKFYDKYTKWECARTS